MDHNRSLREQQSGERCDELRENESPGAVRGALPPYHDARLQKFAKKLKKILHLWKIPVISTLAN
jgi:hypothetical protein